VVKKYLKQHQPDKTTMLELLKKLSELESTKIILESNQSLDECGDMMSSNNTPASISMTAGSGEELGNMLKTIMNLAGVKEYDPVLKSTPSDIEADSGVELIGTDDSENTERPLEEFSPFAALAGMAARAAVGAMAGDAVKKAFNFDDDEDELTREEYDNTPNKATDVMDIDMEELAYQPNKGDHRERQAGLARAMPTEEVKETYEKLMKEYKSFQNKDSALLSNKAYTFERMWRNPETGDLEGGLRPLEQPQKPDPADVPMPGNKLSPKDQYSAIMKDVQHVDQGRRGLAPSMQLQRDSDKGRFAAPGLGDQGQFFEDDEVEFVKNAHEKLMKEYQGIQKKN
jgi:hypothetical protein